MKKEILSVVLTSTLLVACGDSEKQILVKDYFNAMQTKDVVTLQSILKNPKNADMFSPESGFSMTSKNFEILDDVPQGVNVKYSRFCYADIVVPTVVVSSDKGYKIDMMATMKGEFKAMKEAKPLKKYCYDFEDKPLSGQLNGKPWAYVKSHAREINWGTNITTSISLYAEDCDMEYSGGCTLPNLNISNLKLDTDGGNFGPRENMTIHTPPGDNETISQGSYRLTNVENNKVKVELSFKADNGNYVNGYVLLDQSK
ncbi:hypothetical protein AADZ86_05965 [Colwelliaceae bacterium BS250]